MKKLKIVHISSTDNELMYILEKSKHFNNLLRNLLKLLKLDDGIDDIYTGVPKLFDMNAVDHHDEYGNGKDIEFKVIVGKDKIFLFIKSTRNEVVRKIITDNCEFVKHKDKRL